MSRMRGGIQVRRAAPIVSLIVVAMGVGGLLGLVERQPHQRSTPGPTVRSTSYLELHVSGWVVNPGVVRVDEGSIVADVIAAAGGLRPGAEVEQVNLAAPVRSGDQVVVPGPSSSEQPAEDGVLSLNRATAAELETLPGVGPVLAERIVAFRDQHGPFRQVEDLLEVPGIGESKLASIRDLVRVP